jgi:CDP-diacylglycerol--glycerol-3-phosphate 3-phosphatidyltransferase
LTQERIRLAGRRLLDPVVSLLARAGVSPSAITLAGLFVTAVAAFLAWDGRFPAAAAVLVGGSLLDAVDGGVARKRDMVSRAGAVLDSSCDRIGEFLIYLALLAGQAGREFGAILYLAPVALAGSFMVSYTRARSEGVGIQCKVGLFTRTERLVLLILALALTSAVGDAGPLVWMLALVSVGTWFTAIQRLALVFSEDRLSLRDRD